MLFPQEKAREREEDKRIIPGGNVTGIKYE
jgi:hypothetical protein